MWVLIPALSIQYCQQASWKAWTSPQYVWHGDYGVLSGACLHIRSPSALTAIIMASGGGSSLFTPICSFVTLTLFLFFLQIYFFSSVMQTSRSREDKRESQYHSLIRTLSWEYLVLVYAFDDKLCLSVWELCLLWLLLWGMGLIFCVRYIGGHRSNHFTCPSLELFVTVSRSCFAYVLWH